MQSQNLNQIEHLFFDYHSLLCNVANNIINDKDAAQDIVQDVFMNVWLKRDKLNWDASLKGYLYKATTNRALNWLEKNSKSVSLENKEIEVGENVVEQTILLKEIQSHLKSSINRLPPRCKTIFVLSRYEGLKYKQIAEQLDISIKTVENQMSIALERLRSDLKPFLPTLISILLAGINLF
ncbi:MAG: RNA polymerase sigma-70 factor [Flavobacteriales bacterium]|nr:RNA polymerase sigma-70 factor [Flavobacteriales bacterium]